MLDALSDDIHFLVLRHQADTDIESGLRNGTWEAICTLLSKHSRVADKRHAPRLLPVKFKQRDLWQLSRQRQGAEPSYRNDGNIEAVTVLVMDLDVPGAKEKATEFFRDFDYILHSTYSYSPEAPYKFRMAVRLQEPVPFDEWGSVYDAIAEQVDSDRQCRNPSRVYSLPTAPAGSNVSPVVERNHGRSGGVSLQLLRSWATAHETRRHRSAPVERVHFGGDDATPEPGEVAIPYSYSALQKRHKGSIDTLRQDDSRHFFALRVARAEISRFGSKTNVPLLIEFIYRASYDHSSKPITAGNTGEELPDIIESAFLKYNDGAYDPVALQRQINSGMATAVQSQTSGIWQMDLQRWHASDKANSAFDQMSQHYRESVLKYRAGEISAVGLFSSILVERGPGNVVSRCQFCAHTVAKTFSAQGKILGDEVIRLVADHCAAHAEEIPPTALSGSCPPSVQVRAAVLLAAKAAAGEMEFIVPDIAELKNNEPVLSPGEPA